MTDRRLAGVVLCWFALLGGGWYWVYRHETTAGATGERHERWPASSTLARASDKATLVMFVHPGCPCSAASFAELDAALDTIASRPRILLVFVGHLGGDAPTANWRAAGRVAGATRVLDPGGALGEAGKFGVRTSGHVVVYDDHGSLLFSGGITGARGHAGDNVGRRALVDVLAGRTAATQHRVFGCSLET